MTRRTHISLRLSPGGIAKARELAGVHHLPLAVILRAAIAIGFRSPRMLADELDREVERP